MARQPRRLAGIGATDLSDAAAFDAYVGPAREVVVDPVRSIIALHDGVTPGGKRFTPSGVGDGGGVSSYSTLSLALAMSEAVQAYVATGDVFADNFRSDGMIDNANSVGIDKLETGYLKPTTTGDTYTSSVKPTYASDQGNGYGGFGVRARVPASLLSTSGDRVRVAMRGAPSGGSQYTSVWIGEAGVGANFAATPTQIFFSGSPGVTVGAGATVMSDDTVFALDETKDYIVSYGIAASPGGLPRVTTATGFTNYDKTGAAAEAGNVSVTGYASLASNVLGLDEIRVRTAIGPSVAMTVVSDVVPSAAEPDSIGGEVRVVPIDALTLNTDIAISVTRGGGAWVTATLEEAFQDGGTYVLRFAPADLTGQPSGNLPRYRVITASGKRLKLDGVALLMVAE